MYSILFCKSTLLVDAAANPFPHRLLLLLLQEYEHPVSDVKRRLQTTKVEDHAYGAYSISVIKWKGGISMPLCSLEKCTSLEIFSTYFFSTNSTRWLMRYQTQLETIF